MAGELSNQEAERLVLEGAHALRDGRFAVARDRFDTVTKTGRANAQIWLLLATTCRAQKDATGEEAALDALLQVEPRSIRGRIMKGDRRAGAGDGGSALGFYMSALQLAAGQTLPNDLAAEMRRAEAAVADLKARRIANREQALASKGAPPEGRSPRFQQSLDILSGAKQAFVQNPTGYYFPELAPIQFFDPDQFSWAAGIEAATGAIRAELDRLLAAGTAGFKPYIRSDPNRPRMNDTPLLDSMNWSAMFLCENGEVFPDAVAKCPETWARVQAAPMPFIANSPTVFFSVLRAGARIAPHTGTHNTRLICHLPLIVPPGCGFRVGNEERGWDVGKLLIFDDTIEHEAWNESGEDRVVLIFEIWRPELSEQERREVGALFYASSLE